MEGFRDFFEHEHVWSATKQEIIQMWNNLWDDTPLIPTPIPSHHSGSTYGQDVIRITGTATFIGGILSRLKDFLRYENPSSQLEVLYHQIIDKNKIPVPGKFVCFIKVKQKNVESITIKKSKKVPKIKLGD